MLTVELVRRGAARHARRTTVRCGGQSLTYAEVDAAANRIANVPAGLGVARGARVGLLVGNGIWLIALDFGCLKASTARVPLNTRLAADEQARMLAATGVRLPVHDADQAGRAGELAAQMDGLRLASLGPRQRQTPSTCRQQWARPRMRTRVRHPMQPTRCSALHLGYRRHAQGSRAHPGELRTAGPARPPAGGRCRQVARDRWQLRLAATAARRSCGPPRR